MHIPIFRIKKLTDGPRHVWKAARHNLREIQQELGVDSDGRIDAARIRLNVVLQGPATARQVADSAQSLMDRAGIKNLRKDAVRALEIVFSLPVDCSVDSDGFFGACVDWTQECFRVPVLSAVIHKDEPTPHVHVLLLPLVDQRMIGSALMGDRKRLQALQDDFHSKVGVRYGLSRQMPTKRLAAAVRQRCATLAVDAIRSNPALLNNPNVVSALHDVVRKNPEQVMAALNLPVLKSKPIKPTDSFVKIMTKPCKNEKHIGFEKSPAGPRDRSLSCVGFPVSTATASSTSDQCSATLTDAPERFWRLVEKASNRQYWCRRCTPSALRG